MNNARFPEKPIDKPQKPCYNLDKKRERENKQ